MILSFVDYSRSSENWARVEVEHEVVKDCMMKFVKKEADDVDSLQKYEKFHVSLLVKDDVMASNQLDIMYFGI